MKDKRANCTKSKSRKVNAKKYSNTNLSWHGIPVTYLPCAHQHFKEPTIDRKCIDREQHLNLLATPKGYRWNMYPANDNCDKGKRTSTLCKQKRKYSSNCATSDKFKFVGKNGMDRLWECPTPENIEKLATILVNDLKLSDKEANNFINEQKDYAQLTQKMAMCHCHGDSENQYTWRREFSDLIGCKLRNHIATIMCSYRTKRQKKLMQLVLKCMSDISGECVNIACPETRTHKIMVLVADRIAIWLDNMLEESNKVYVDDVDTEEKKGEEEKKKKQQEEADRRKEEQKKKEEEKKREEERKRQEKEEEREKEEKKKKREEEERKSKEEQRKKEQERQEREEQKRKEKEEQTKKEREEKKRQEEEKQSQEEQKRKEEEQKRKEEEKKKKEEEQKRKEEEQKKKEEEQKKKEEEQKRKEEEQKRKEEEQKRKEEEEKKKEEEEKNKEEKKKEDENKDRKEEEPKDKQEEQKIIDEKPEEEEESQQKTEELPIEVEEPEQSPEEETYQEPLVEDMDNEVQEEDTQPTEEPKTVDPVNIIVDWIKDTDKVETKRQTLIENVVYETLRRELEKYGDVNEMEGAIDKLSGRVATWVNKLATEAEKEIKTKTSGKAQMFPATEGALYHVKKDEDNYYKVRQISCSDILERKNRIDRPMKSNDVKDFTIWAEGLIKISDAWTKWVENTFCEAYTMHKRNDSKKNLSDNEFNAWKEKKHKEATEWKKTQKCIYNKAQRWEEWAKYTKRRIGDSTK